MVIAIKERLDRINTAIHKHRVLAAWGNVESKQRLRELRKSKKELLAMNL